MELKSNLNYGDYELLKQKCDILPFKMDIRFNIEDVAILGYIWCESIALFPDKNRYVYVIEGKIEDSPQKLKNVFNLLNGPLEISIDRVKYYCGNH